MPVANMLHGTKAGPNLPATNLSNSQFLIAIRRVDFLNPALVFTRAAFFWVSWLYGNKGRRRCCQPVKN